MVFFVQKKLTMLLVLLLLSLVPGTVFANVPVLKVATEAGFMPFEFVEENSNQLAGFDIDLIKALGAELGMEVKIDNINWDGLIPALINRNYDAVIAGMTITPERAESVNFTDPYFESVLTVVTSSTNQGITSLEDLAGKVVAVQINTTGDFVAEDVEGIKSIARYNTVVDAMQALIIRAADAVIVDLPVAEAYLAHNPNAPLTHLGPVSDSEFFGIALHKQNTELLTNLNKALAALKENGIYDQLFQKWFGVEE